jgi:hypothetical protein
LSKSSYRKREKKRSFYPQSRKTPRDGKWSDFSGHVLSFVLKSILLVPSTESPSSLIVTGGAGFIGSNLTLALQEEFPEARLTVIDDFRSGNFKNLAGYRGDFVAHNLATLNWRENFPSFTGFGRTPSAILRRTVFSLIPPNIRPASSRLIKNSPFESLIPCAFPLWLARPYEALLGFSPFAAGSSREHMDQHNHLISPVPDPFLTQL